MLIYVILCVPVSVMGFFLAHHLGVSLIILSFLLLSIYVFSFLPSLVFSLQILQPLPLDVHLLFGKFLRSPVSIIRCEILLEHFQC